jgi:hypothetical protein
MSGSISMTLSERVSKISEYLSLDETRLLKEIQKSYGTDNEQLLLKLISAPTTDSSYAVEAILSTLKPGVSNKSEGYYDKAGPVFDACVVVLTLGVDPIEDPESWHAKTEVPQPSSYVKSEMLEQVNNQQSVANLADAIIKRIDESKPIEQQPTKELFSSFIESGEPEYEAELVKRSYGRRFIAVGLDGSVNMDLSLELLKRARKKEDIPPVYRDTNGDIIEIYTVIEFSPGSRILEESPLSPPTILFDGYCSSTDMNYSGITDKMKSCLRYHYEKDLKTSQELSGCTYPKDHYRNLINKARAGEDALYKILPAATAVDFEKLWKAGIAPNTKRLRKPEVRTSPRTYDPFNAGGL